jgi:PPIC-type PPIASE domain
MHFLVLGGLFFAIVARLEERPARVPPSASTPARQTGSDSAEAASAGRGSAPVGPATISFTAADVDRLRDGWRSLHGRAPTPSEEDALLREEGDREMLHREALRLVSTSAAEPVRRRLVQLARLVELGPSDDEAALAGEARRLGLDRSDPVLRRHLIDTMRLALASAPRGEVLGDEEVRAYYDANADRFTEPPRTRLTHVYLSRARHADLAGDAAALLARLEAGGVPPEDGPALGDPFLRGASLDLAPGALDRAFGPGFAALVSELPSARWSGPVASVYGLHLVWVHERTAARPAPFEAVRGRVVHALLRDRAEIRLRDRLAALRAWYPLEIEVDSGGVSPSEGREGGDRS